MKWQRRIGEKVKCLIHGPSKDGTFLLSSSVKTKQGDKFIKLEYEVPHTCVDISQPLSGPLFLLLFFCILSFSYTGLLYQYIKIVHTLYSQGSSRFHPPNHDWHPPFHSYCGEVHNCIFFSTPPAHESLIKF